MRPLRRDVRVRDVVRILQSTRLFELVREAITIAILCPGAEDDRARGQAVVQQQRRGVCDSSRNLLAVQAAVLRPSPRER